MTMGNLKEIVKFGVTLVDLSSRTRARETQSGEIPARRGETLEHDSETFLEKLPFFTCGARETQSSNLRDCQNHEPLSTSHVSNLKESVDTQRGCDNP